MGEDWKKKLDPDIDRRIQRFADEGLAGTVGLNFNQGEVQSADMKDHIRVQKGKVAEKG